MDPRISMTEKRISVTENISLKFIGYGCEDNKLTRDN
jgi:hypothetical protein